MSLLTVLALALPTALAQNTGQIPAQISFKGLHLDSVGLAFDDSVNLDFTLFGSLVASPSLWSENHLGVIIAQGLYSVDRGASRRIEPAILITGATSFEITLGGDTLVPRQQFLFVPHALVAQNPENIGGASALFIQQLSE